jgi:hypothetical protein
MYPIIGIMRENTASQNEWSLMSSENVLKKLLQTRPEEKILEKFLKPEPVVKKKRRLALI